MTTTPDPQLVQARAAASRGDVRGALALYQQIVQRRPRAPEVHHEAGLLLARAGKRQLALRHLGIATRLEPTNAGYQFALAQHLSSARQYERAIDAFNTARRLDPTNVEAHTNAATLLEIQGKSDAAREAAGSALEIDPGHARARTLAMRLDFRAGAPDEATLVKWKGELRSIVERADAVLTRALALDLLVDVAEKLDDHACAWQAILDCNEADRMASGRALPGAAARNGYLNMVGALERFMTPERGAAWRDERPDDALPAPALLVGFPRSGTTMTERAIDAHPRVRSIEEQPTFELARNQLPRIVPRQLLATTPIPDVLDHLTPDHVSQLRRAYWQQACRVLGLEEPPADSVILDKMPLRITDLPFVNRIFPEARVLVALRDPRDVCLSCVRQRLGYAGNIPMSFLLSLEDTARLYAGVMRSWLSTREAYTFPWKEIRYEDTVADFEARIREMLVFLGLEFDEAVLSFHRRTDRMHNTPSYHAVRQKVTTRAVGRWRRYEAQLAPILPTLGPFVGAFGYDQAPPGEPTA